MSHLVSGAGPPPLAGATDSAAGRPLPHLFLFSISPSVPLSKALELSPDCSEFFLNRGLAYESIADGLLMQREKDAMQFYEAAIGDYDHAIVLDPNNHRYAPVTSLSWCAAVKTVVGSPV